MIFCCSKQLNHTLLLSSLTQPLSLLDALVTVVSCYCDWFVLLMYSIEWLVIDESDKLFEDGETGFRDQVGMFIVVQC